MKSKTKALTIDQQTRRIYYAFSKPYLSKFITAILARTVFVISAYLGNIYLVSIALDRLTSHKTNDFWHEFGLIILAVIIMEIIRLLTEQLNLQILWKQQVKVQNDLAQHCYNNLINQDYNFHANHFTGSLVAQTNRFVASYERLTDSYYWNVYPLVLTIIFSSILLYIKLPAFGVLFFFVVLLYTYTSYKFNKNSAPLNAERAGLESANTGQLADSITNTMVVKSYARENHESKRYKNGLYRIEKSNDRLRKFILKKDVKLGGMVSFISAMALIISIVSVFYGHASIGTIALATALSRDSLQRLREFNSNTLRNIARSYGDARDMTEILMSKTDVTDTKLPIPFTVDKGQIEFNDVDFWYNEKSADQALFNGLNITIKPGERVGLVGPSGGGKTTITKLLLRFMDIQSGRIMIDGQDIAKARQADLRRAISYVPQEPLLFHRSLTENIAYGLPDANEDEIILAAQKAHADEFIKKLPQGYDTLVGERGVKLSGGQRQRVAIARAMLKNAPILVLDEATSALDSEAEVLIQDALWKLMQGKTALVIAHRLSTIQKMDRIVVMDEGRIVEQGSHAQLIKKRGGLYAKLWKHQSGGFLQDN